MSDEKIIIIILEKSHKINLNLKKKNKTNNCIIFT